jgi:hypothetical protein
MTRIRRRWWEYALWLIGGYGVGHIAFRIVTGLLTHQ